jgi:hypothetical protein
VSFVLFLEKITEVGKGRREGERAEGPREERERRGEARKWREGRGMGKEGRREGKGQGGEGHANMRQPPQTARLLHGPHRACEGFS